MGGVCRAGRFRATWKRRNVRRAARIKSSESKRSFVARFIYCDGLSPRLADPLQRTF
jgi:hypothetical protein